MSAPLSPPPSSDASEAPPTPGSGQVQKVASTVSYLWLTVPRDVWRGDSVEAITRVADAVARRERFVAIGAFAGVGAFAGLASFFTVIRLPGDSAGLAFLAFFGFLALVTVIYLLRSLTVWWALRTRDTTASFREATAVVAVPACLHVFALAAMAVLSVFPGAFGTVLRIIVVLPLTLVVAMVTEPLIYIATARRAGPGKSVLMPHTWFLLVFAALLTVVVFLAALLGIGAILDELVSSLNSWGIG